MLPASPMAECGLPTIKEPVAGVCRHLDRNLLRAGWGARWLREVRHQTRWVSAGETVGVRHDARGYIAESLACILSTAGR